MCIIFFAFKVPALVEIAIPTLTTREVMIKSHMVHYVARCFQCNYLLPLEFAYQVRFMSMDDA